LYPANAYVHRKSTMNRKAAALNALVKGLNQSCLCVVLRPGEIGASFLDAAGSLLPDDLEKTHPHLFAHTPVYVTEADLAAMLSLARAMERIAAMPGWLGEGDRNQAAAKVHGVFMGYDFHMTPDGPKLIEINTNAGGAFLNLFASKQFRACCDMLDMSKFIEPKEAEKNIADMFLAEWAAAGRAGRPGLIAIVDAAPKEQFLYPEFLLAAKLLNEYGLKTVVAAPEELALENGALRFDGRLVDLIYNRLTDFDLSDHPDIHNAWASGNVVLTPDPPAHRRMADKRNLVKLSDAALLRGIGVCEQDIAIASRLVPKTVLVTPENSEALWAERKRYYFKPASGYGGKAVYRGEKLTRKSWDYIVGQDYVAQTLASPSHRIVKADGGGGLLKFDVRLYTYRDQLLAAAARIYEGQTTNFRTPGGGFAPVTAV
jgi:hypothetical protein